MVKGQRVKGAKTEFIRQTLAEHPDWTPSQVVDHVLKEHGVKVTASHVSVTKTHDTGKRGTKPHLNKVKPYGTGQWAKARAYLKEHPDATVDEVIAATGASKPAVYNVRSQMRQRGMIGGVAVEKFRAVRDNLRRTGVLPGDEEAVRPFRVELTVDDRGLEIVLNNCNRVIGKLDLTPETLTFIKGRAERSLERPLSFDALSVIQGVL